MTIRELIEEQRARVRSGNSAERFAAVLLIPSVLADRLRELDDFSLGQLLEHEVCSNLSLLAPELTVCMVAAERLCRSVRTGKSIARRRSWTATRNDGEHIMHAESALYRAGIPFLLLPFQQNRCASNMFMVSNIAEARACLLEAGFQETSRCPPVLIHWTRQTIQLREDKHRSSHVNS